MCSSYRFWWRLWRRRVSVACHYLYNIHVMLLKHKKLKKAKGTLAGRWLSSGFHMGNNAR